MNAATKTQLWIGRVLSGIVILFLLFDGITKLMHIAPVIEAMTQLGYPESSITTVGVLVLICTALYALPRTAALGAVLLTGFLGGAVATNLRVDAPLFTHLLFSFYVAAFIWSGLLLREPRLLPLLGLRRLP